MSLIDQNDKLMLLAMRNYDNPHCFHLNEFLEDFNRIHYIKRLLNKYIKTGEMKERLIINHLIILYNCFGETANTIIFSILDQSYYKFIKPFITLLNRDKEIILDLYNNVILISKIEQDLNVQKIIDSI